MLGVNQENVAELAAQASNSCGERPWLLFAANGPHCDAQASGWPDVCKQISLGWCRPRPHRLHDRNVALGLRAVAHLGVEADPDQHAHLAVTCRSRPSGTPLRGICHMSSIP